MHGNYANASVKFFKLNSGKKRNKEKYLIYSFILCTYKKLKASGIRRDGDGVVIAVNGLISFAININ